MAWCGSFDGLPRPGSSSCAKAVQAKLENVTNYAGHGLVMKIGDFGMSRQVIMQQVGGEACLERALSANVIGTAAYSAPELLLADSPVKKNRVDAATVLKSDVSSTTVPYYCFHPVYCYCSSICYSATAVRACSPGNVSVQACKAV